MARTTTRAKTKDEVVVAHDLVRRFGDVVAVDGVDLSIKEGEIFGFLGPNGAGKSTTVRMLTTLLRPTEGTATVAGHDVVRDADAVRRSIGVALQDAAIDPLMTGRELLVFQSVLHGLSKRHIAEKGEGLLDLVGLTAAADRRVGTYSGGMRRRLDLALALVHDPVVLFLDEPTTGLDPNSRVALWEEVRRLNKESGTTVFLTTQYMEEADVLAGRIAIIDEGKIVAEGTPAKLKAKVGDPTLRVAIAAGEDKETAERVLAKFGEIVKEERIGSAIRQNRTGNRGSEYLPDAIRGFQEDDVAIRLREGAAKVGAVSRALDRAKIAIEGIELHNPTLDDVFHIATGRRLEGAAEE